MSTFDSTTPPADIDHQRYMRIAIAEAKRAGQTDEVPIGAVIVDQSGELLAQAHNQTVARADPTAHAEIIAIRFAAEKLSNYRLLYTTMYVTVEPCVMCMGAILHARISRVVYGAVDPRWGAAGTLYDFSADRRFNHRPGIVSGICEARCRELMQAFFREKRRGTGQ